MRVECPACKQAIPAESINVAKDVAMCPACREAFALSELVAQGHETDSDLGEPPSGTWFCTEPNGWELGGTTRHPIAFFPVPFMCVWSGSSLGSIYGSQIIKGEFDLTMSLFGLPFVAGTVLFGSIMLMVVAGKVTIRVEGGDGVIFTGVGSFGWNGRFRWDDVNRVEEIMTSFRSPGNSGRMLALEGKTRLTFGSMLSQDRRFSFSRYCDACCGEHPTPRRNSPCCWRRQAVVQ
jgi:hypothetical protein